MKEPSDQQMDDYMATQEHMDWVEQERGGRDWVEFEEMNSDCIYESCCEWLDRNMDAAMEVDGDHRMQEHRK